MKSTNIARLLASLTVCVRAASLTAQSVTPESVITRQVHAYFTAMGKGEMTKIEQALAPDYLIISSSHRSSVVAPMPAIPPSAHRLIRDAPILQRCRDSGSRSSSGQRHDR